MDIEAEILTFLAGDPSTAIENSHEWASSKKLDPQAVVGAIKSLLVDAYVATEDLQMAVNAAVTLQRPLLIKGEPGTGKTMLAEEVAESLGFPLIQWHIKSTTKHKPNHSRNNRARAMPR